MTVGGLRRCLWLFTELTITDIVEVNSILVMLNWTIGSAMFFWLTSIFNEVLQCSERLVLNREISP